jgi:hypothetical protein
MTIQQRLFVLTLQLRFSQFMSSVKTLWRSMYPSNMWSFMMLQGSLIIASFFGIILIVSNIFN